MDLGTFLCEALSIGIHCNFWWAAEHDPEPPLPRLSSSFQPDRPQLVSVSQNSIPQELRVVSIGTQKTYPTKFGSEIARARWRVQVPYSNGVQH